MVIAARYNPKPKTTRTAATPSNMRTPRDTFLYRPPNCERFAVDEQEGRQMVAVRRRNAELDKPGAAARRGGRGRYGKSESGAGRRRGRVTASRSAGAACRRGTTPTEEPNAGQVMCRDARGRARGRALPCEAGTLAGADRIHAETSGGARATAARNGSRWSSAPQPGQSVTSRPVSARSHSTEDDGSATRCGVRAEI